MIIAINKDTKLSMEQEKFLTKKVSPKLFSC